MPQQNKVYLDDQGQELQQYLDEKTGELVAPVKKAVEAANTPVKPARTGLGKEATDKAAEGSYFGKGMNMLMDTLGSFTSPASLITGGLGIGEAIAAKAGLATAQKIANIGSRGAAGFMVGEGVANTPEHPIAGPLEAVAGMTGMRIRGPGAGYTRMEGMGAAPTGKPRIKMAGPETGILEGGHPAHVNQLEQQGFIAGEPVPGGITMHKPANRPPTELPHVNIKQSFGQELFNFPRAATSGFDLSAPLRQGFNLIGRKEFRKSLVPMLEAAKTAEGYAKIENEIMSHPNFQQAQIMGPGGKLVTMPSFAKRAGLKLSDVADLSTREEQIMSTLTEKLPVVGGGYKASNRAYTAFLNKLRADTFNSMVGDLEKAGIPIKSDLMRAKELAAFINDATGRGSLGKLEEHATTLNGTLFSPRLAASRVRMYNRYLNPWSYIDAPPELRKEALKSLLSSTAAGGTVLGLLKMAGAEVGDDPNSADFGKAKIGNVRVDPWAGFQQYAVLAHRLMTNSSTSTSGNKVTLGEGFGTDTAWDVTERFAANKTNPVVKFAYDWMQSNDYKPFNVPAEALRLAVPMMVQDIWDLSQEDPNLLPLAIPASLGMGVQVYGSGQ